MTSYRQRLKNPINGRTMKRAFVYIAVVTVALCAASCGDDTSKPKTRPNVSPSEKPEEKPEENIADSYLYAGQLLYDIIPSTYEYVGKGRLHVREVIATKARGLSAADYPSLTIPSHQERRVYKENGSRLIDLQVTAIDLDDCDPGITWLHYPVLYFQNGVNHVPSTLTLEEGVDSIINMYPMVDELRDLWLPSTFKYIGPNAFEQTIHAINHLYNFPDSMRIHAHSLEDWCKISIDTANVRVNMDEDGYNERPFVLPYFTLCVGDDIISDLTIPPSITKIGPCAFSGSRIKTIVLHDGVTEIGSYAFGFCENLNSVRFSSGLKKIGPYAFYRCKIPKTFEIPASVESIGAYAFARTRIHEITIPANVRKLEEGTFYWSSLKDVYLPSGMVSIGKNAFSGSTLTNIHLPESLREMGESTFAFSDIREITLPDNLEQIPEKAFYRCDSLKSITLSKGLKTIKEEAFGGIYGTLTDVYCPCDTPPKIEGGWMTSHWKPAPKTKVRLHVPAKAVEKYKVAEYWNECDIVPME